MTFRFSGQIAGRLGEIVIFQEHVLAQSRQTPAPEAGVNKWKVKPSNDLFDYIVTAPMTRDIAQTFGTVIGKAE